jgi:hypothetical protein
MANLGDFETDLAEAPPTIGKAGFDEWVEKSETSNSSDLIMHRILDAGIEVALTCAKRNMNRSKRMAVRFQATSYAG